MAAAAGAQFLFSNRAPSSRAAPTPQPGKRGPKADWLGVAAGREYYHIRKPNPIHGHLNSGATAGEAWPLRAREKAGRSRRPNRHGTDTCIHVQCPPMVGLVLNRRLNYRNIMLAQETRGEQVGYLLADGGRRFVPWLGFIERAEARAMKAGRPVRLVDITRVGRANGLTPEWRDLPAGSFVHGCLTPRGAYAVYEENVCVVGARRATR